MSVKKFFKIYVSVIYFAHLIVYNTMVKTDIV
jgi:hypothetical protein